MQVAMTVNSRVMRSIVTSSPDAIDIPMKNGLRIQILPCIDDLARAKKNQFAAFIAEEELLVVWDDNANNLVKRAKAIEAELMEIVWGNDEEDEGEDMIEEKNGIKRKTVELDFESGELIPEYRPTNLMNTILVAFTLIIVITLLGLAFRSLATEIAVDHGYIRLAFVALVPVQIFFTLVSRWP
jgi:hypothetical protein